MIALNNRFILSRRVTPAAGLSLLELLIILAVLSILFTIGALNFGSFAQQRRLDEAARTVGETMRLIGSQAVTTSQIVTFTLPAEKNLLRWENELEVIQEQPLPHNATVDIDQFTSGQDTAEIIFSGRGFPDTGYTFTVTLREGLTKRVNLLATGAVVYLD